MRSRVQSDLTLAAADAFEQTAPDGPFVAAELFDEHRHLSNACDLLVSPVDTRTLVVFGMSLRSDARISGASSTGSQGPTGTGAR
jgi:hypothetical protein